MTDLERLAELTLAELQTWSEDERGAEELVLALFGRFSAAGYVLCYRPDLTNPPDRVFFDEYVVDLR